MATEEILATGVVQDITAFIAACGFPPEAFVLVERLPQHVLAHQQERQDLLRFAHLSDSIEPSLYTSGRVFHPDFELRWKQEAQRTRVVYLGQARDLPELSPGKKLDEWQAGLQPREKSYYLFGEYLNKKRLEQMGLPEGQGYYAEVRIPRLLQYPAKAQRVQLIVREYLEKRTSQVQLFRFQNLKPVEEEHESV